jgi:hypothetical protein
VPDSSGISLAARRAFNSRLNRRRSVVEEGQVRREIRSSVNAMELATPIVTTLEGSLMLERLQRTPEPLNIARRHLEENLETNIRAEESKA